MQRDSGLVSDRSNTEKHKNVLSGEIRKIRRNSTITNSEVHVNTMLLISASQIINVRNIKKLLLYNISESKCSH